MILAAGGSPRSIVPLRQTRRVLNRLGLTALARRVTQAMDLPPVRPHRRVKGSVWGVCLVKNEADIIVPVVEHLFRQGVEGVLIADNDSTDDTPALLSQLAERYPVHLARDREEGHFQSLKTDLLCDWARRAGADWIIPFDGDEFWFAPGATLSEYLRACKFNIVRAAIHNLFPVAGVEFREGPWRLETTPHAMVKVAFRSYRYSMLKEGAHGVHRPGPSSSGLRMLHVPWRSYAQFRRKGQQGSAAMHSTGFVDTGAGCHWLNIGGLGDEAARETWHRVITGQAVENIDICWSPGRPVRLVDPSKWLIWDPEGILASGTP